MKQLRDIYPYSYIGRIEPKFRFRAKKLGHRFQNANAFS